MATSSEYVNDILQFTYGADTAINTTSRIQLGRTTSAALLMGGGTAASPLTCSTADKNFFGHWVKSSATSGTSRGEYLRLYLTGGAGGEALRVFTTVSSNTPADTVNGAHISLSFGASAGNVTGLGTGIRSTLHVPDRALTGTTTAIQAELSADGTSSSLVGGSGSFLRCSFGGDTTGAAAVEDAAYFVSFDGGSINTSNMIAAKSSAAVTHVLRILVYGVPYYIMLSNAI